MCLGQCFYNLSKLMPWPEEEVLEALSLEPSYVFLPQLPNHLYKCTSLKRWFYVCLHVSVTMQIQGWVFSAMNFFLWPH